MIRSVLYNLLFYGLTVVICTIALPMLLLPRPAFMSIVYVYTRINSWLERFVLALKYEVRGAEKLPADGRYIVAAKHQSAYETLKLHVLFRDPAIILKRELLSIPLWGWYLAKSDVIAIDRSSREAATQSIQEGAKRMAAQGRPIVIFPQGTRVTVDVSTDEKPYKLGVARMQEATGLPIIPLALNAGMFWPRNSFWKKPGTVVFEFLPPIAAGQPKDKVIKILETQTEEASKRLMEEAESHKSEGSGASWIVAALLLFTLFCAYSSYWFTAAKQVKDNYVAAIGNTLTPEITGYPLKMRLFSTGEWIETPQGLFEVETIRAEAWPFPWANVDIRTGPLRLEEMEFDNLQARVRFGNDVLSILGSRLMRGEFQVLTTGTIDFSHQPHPKPDLVLRLKDYESLIDELIAGDLINERTAKFTAAGLGALKDKDGIVSLPLHQTGKTIKIGPFPIYTIPDTQGYTRRKPPPIP